jgi:hypothetical protein
MTSLRIDAAALSFTPNGVQSQSPAVASLASAPWVGGHIRGNTPSGVTSNWVREIRWTTPVLKRIDGTPLEFNFVESTVTQDALAGLRDGTPLAVSE